MHRRIARNFIRKTRSSLLPETEATDSLSVPPLQPEQTLLDSLDIDWEDLIRRARYIPLSPKTTGLSYKILSDNYQSLFIPDPSNPSSRQAFVPFIGPDAPPIDQVLQDLQLNQVDRYRCSLRH